MSQLQLPVELPRTKPTLALESCADFFDRDYDTLAVDVQNGVIKFSWDISSGKRKVESVGHRDTENTEAAREDSRPTGATLKVAATTGAAREDSRPTTDATINVAVTGKAALEDGRPTRREIRIYAPSAWAFCYGKPMPDLTEAQVYKLILPNRDIRSTELKRILACSHQHVYELKNNFTVTREPAAFDGPNSFTVFSRASIEAFLRSRRLS